MSATSNPVTIIQLTPDQLEDLITKAVHKALDSRELTSDELWSVSQVADHFGVTSRTIRNWELECRLPARVSARRWKKADILKCRFH